MQNGSHHFSCGFWGFFIIFVTFLNGKFSIFMQVFFKKEKYFFNGFSQVSEREFASGRKTLEMT
jgi:hypothetical protein